ncbi:hypothetical protein [Luethyella okanaganae]|uniref:ATP/GTP-binding protein n=1 Tax=Luethyella okanaganae TaxID=69372 RepID=A0ABW1VFK2_9MICO
MPRSNRPRGRTPGRSDEGASDLSRVLAGWKRTEAKRDGLWHIQPVAALQAVKSYVCPGCGLDIDPGVAHLVTWRADGVMGDGADITARRHWHSHCWKIA